MNDDATTRMLDELRGRQLSAVTFVMSYLQLSFDGPCINVTNPLTVRTPTIEARSWNPGFRDALCAQISKIVTSVGLIPEALTIRFMDGSLLAVSLLEDDYTGREAVYAHAFKNKGGLVI
jgi:hypothetical protein